MLYRAVGLTAVLCWWVDDRWWTTVRYVIPNFRENVREMYKLRDLVPIRPQSSSDLHGICRFFGGDSVENEVVDEKLKH